MKGLVMNKCDLRLCMTHPIHFFMKNALYNLRGKEGSGRQDIVCTLYALCFSQHVGAGEGYDDEVMR